MNDPRLNSVHLEAPRREDFRKARGQLLDARGSQTVALELDPDAVGNSHTMLQDALNRLPKDSNYWLVDRESVYPLKVGVNTIGRLPDNDVVIEGPYVSRRHCAILVHAANSCELYDIASKNGTFLNGLKLEGPTRISAGDQIRMCDRNIVFMSKNSGPGQPHADVTRSE